jgi:hypothetical protein
MMFEQFLNIAIIVVCAASLLLLGYMIGHWHGVRRAEREWCNQFLNDNNN